MTNRSCSATDLAAALRADIPASKIETVAKFRRYSGTARAIVEKNHIGGLLAPTRGTASYSSIIAALVGFSSFGAVSVQVVGH